MLNLAMLRTFNNTEMLGIWFLLAVASLLVAWLFDWLMNKSGIGLIASTLATGCSLIGGLYLAEWVILMPWRRAPLTNEVSAEFTTPEGDMRTHPGFWPEIGGLDGFYAARLVKS